MFKWLKDISEGCREGWREARETRRLLEGMRAVANIQLREGTILVFEHPRCLSKLAVENIKRSVGEVMKVKAVILEEGMKLAGVVHRHDALVEFAAESGKMKVSPRC